MRRFAPKVAGLLLAGCLSSVLVPAPAKASVLVESWENTVDGWGVFGAPFTSEGFSTTTGVTNGTYSWVIGSPTPTAPSYGGVFGSSASTSLTALLATATSITLDVYTAPGSFSYQQWDLDLNNSGSFGYNSVDGYSFPESPVIGSESTLTWAITPAINAYMAANPTTTTSLNFQIGGGTGSGATVFDVDNLRAVLPVPEPASASLLGLAGVSLLGRRRRK